MRFYVTKINGRESRQSGFGKVTLMKRIMEFRRGDLIMDVTIEKNKPVNNTERLNSYPNLIKECVDESCKNISEDRVAEQKNTKEGN